MKLVLEYYDKKTDVWGRIEDGNWKNLKELKLHIEILKKQSNNEEFYFITDKNHSNIPEEYKFRIHGFYERYNSYEKRNEALNRINQYIPNYYDLCPLII